MLKPRRAIVFAFLVYSSDAVQKMLSGFPNSLQHRRSKKRERLQTKRLGRKVTPQKSRYLQYLISAGRKWERTGRYTNTRSDGSWAISESSINVNNATLLIYSAIADLLSNSPPAEKTRLLLTMLKPRRAIVFAFLVYSSDAVEKCNIAAQRLQTKRGNFCKRRGLSRLTIRTKNSERRRPTGRTVQHIPPCPEFIRSQDYTIVTCTDFVIIWIAMHS